MTQQAWSLLVGILIAACLQGCSWSFFGEDSWNRHRYETASTTVRTTTTTTSVFTCPTDPELPAPKSAEEHRGKSWPTLCFDKNESHFFGIGDWGGDTAGHVWWNAKSAHGQSGKHGPADDWAAKYVGRQMKTLADKVKPDFVLNAGDNFYPGGINQNCMANWNSSDPTHQFTDVFGGVTPVYGEGVGDIPWLSVLGNHDYGGFKFNSGWDQQIYHTWSGADNWRLPAQYWHQHVKYAGFSVDVFMLDSNFPDTGAASDSNMCDSKQGPWTCWSLARDGCAVYFHQLWKDGVAWLEQKMQETISDGDGPNWRILLTHFPPSFWGSTPEVSKIAELHQKYGFHLVFTGHTHGQEFWFGGSAKMDVNWIISGGGGGISSESPPSLDGKDLAYGFVDFKISSKDLTVEFFSWGGEDGLFQEPMISKKILQSQPRTAATDTGRAHKHQWLTVV